MSRISFSEAEAQIAKLYIELAQSNVRAFEVFYEDMTEICRAHAFEPMVNFTNTIYRFYQEDIKQYLLNEFRSWADSSYSLDALVRAINAGRDAEQTAKAVMQRIGDALEDMFRLRASEIQIDTNAPSLSEQDILKMKDCAEVFLRASREAGDLAKSDIRRIGEENNAVICLTRIVHSTADSLTDSFEAIKKQTDEGADTFREGVQKVGTDSVGYQHTSVEIGSGLNWPDDFI